MTINLAEVINDLEALADPQKVIIKQERFGINALNSMGIYQKDLQTIAKKIKYDTELAIQLFDTGIYEARILCSKIIKPEHITEQLMERWVSSFENWEICDSFCMGLFAKSSFAQKKVFEWSSRNREFEKRAGFVIIAAYCMAEKKAANEVFEGFLPLIEKEATDNRLYVKKAVNWALRNIGKRNIDLNRSAKIVANKISKTNSSPAKWIANNALKELEKPTINILDYPRQLYRHLD